MEGMGSVPILPVKRSVSIGTMLKFDGDGDGHGTCKRTYRSVFVRIRLIFILLASAALGHFVFSSYSYNVSAYLMGHPVFGPIFMIFVHFSAKNMSKNRLASPPIEMTLLL